MPQLVYIQTYKIILIIKDGVLKQTVDKEKSYKTCFWYF